MAIRCGSPKLAGEVNTAMKSEALAKFVANLNIEPLGESGEAVNREYAAVVDRHSRIVEESGIELD